MPNKWDTIAKKATATTKEKFKSEISSLTRLNDQDVQGIITNTGIGKEDLVKVLQEVKKSAKSNLDKAKAIQKINKGVTALVAIAGKLL
jgi:hypothetical protein